MKNRVGVESSGKVSTPGGDLSSLNKAQLLIAICRRDSPGAMCGDVLYKTSLKHQVSSSREAVIERGREGFSRRRVSFCRLALTAKTSPDPVHVARLTPQECRMSPLLVPQKTRTRQAATPAGNDETGCFSNAPVGSGAGRIPRGCGAREATDGPMDAGPPKQSRQAGS